MRASAFWVALLVGPVTAASFALACGTGFPRTTLSGGSYWNSVCPDRLEDVDAGRTCAPASAFDAAPETRPVCDYERGFCECRFDDCEDGAAGCSPRYVWHCQEDPARESPTCPQRRHGPGVSEGTPCSAEGAVCSYDLTDPHRSPRASCFVTFACKAGAFRSEGETCGAR